MKLIERLQTAIRAERSSSEFLAIIHKLEKIEKQMKTASGERLQRLAERQATLEVMLNECLSANIGKNIEYRGSGK